MGDAISAITSSSWEIKGRQATHVPTGRMVVNNDRPLRDDAGTVYLQSRLDGLDGAPAEVQKQALDLWHAGRLGPVHVAPPGLLGIA